MYKRYSSGTYTKPKGILCHIKAFKKEITNTSIVNKMIIITTLLNIVVKLISMLNGANSIMIMR
jgi:hypothetical protein